MEQLFVYESLKPGRPNEHLLAESGGEFVPASIRGRLADAGWGRELGLPGLRLDEQGPEVRGHLFRSKNLGAAWARLDAFEGDEYCRREAVVLLHSGETVVAQVYALNPTAGSSP